MERSDEALKPYNFTVYGRSNSILLSIRNKHLLGGTVRADNPKDARLEAWIRYRTSSVFDPCIHRNDVRIEIEAANETNSLAILLGKKLLPRR